jgi:hypothetical protein
LAVRQLKRYASWVQTVKECVQELFNSLNPRFKTSYTAAFDSDIKREANLYRWNPAKAGQCRGKFRRKLDIGKGSVLFIESLVLMRRLRILYFISKLNPGPSLGPSLFDRDEVPKS